MYYPQTFKKIIYYCVIINSFVCVLINNKLIFLFYSVYKVNWIKFYNRFAWLINIYVYAYVINVHVHIKDTIIII